MRSNVVAAFTAFLMVSGMGVAPVSAGGLLGGLVDTVTDTVDTVTETVGGVTGGGGGGVGFYRR